MTGRIWPTIDPRAPPVTMMGPSAPNGAPVPIAIAADSGLAMAVLGAIRLWRRSTASMASGIPWPRMIGAKIAMVAITRAPMAAAMGSRGQRSTSFSGGISPDPHSPRRATWVIRLIMRTNR